MTAPTAMPWKPSVLPITPNASNVTIMKVPEFLEKSQLNGIVKAVI